MNIVFWFLIVVAVVGLWFLLSSWFVKIGFFADFWVKKAKDELNKEDIDS